MEMRVVQFNASNMTQSIRKQIWRKKKKVMEKLQKIKRRWGGINKVCQRIDIFINKTLNAMKTNQTETVQIMYFDI